MIGSGKGEQGRGHRLLGAVDDVKDAVGQAGLLGKRGEDHGGAGIDLGRLDDVGVS